ncbi:hypothetical protein D9613_010735 [Agrocybe pediades]|uniref:Uncharacterized protein n=1 Tax=Agrocybe pediades TaxID=84607 RepID=A0A8H4QL82_9AGAR|nr:hypothetical protein D9613_010735 [Agrocybe pediades]
MSTTAPDIPQIFVDDSDPSIVYNGNNAWVAVTNVSTVPQPFVVPARGPFYGTIHQVKGNATLSYIYNDGKRTSSLLDELAGNFFCPNPGDILEAPGDGQHNLTISITLVSPNTIATPLRSHFDGLFYTPSNQSYAAEVRNADVAYGLQQALDAGMNFTSGKPPSVSSPHLFPGDGFDFDFEGTSMAVYVSSSGIHPTTVPSNLSYSIDDGPSINFTLENPFTFNNSVSQLILQTPQYAQGRHHLHFDFLGPVNNDTACTLDALIVQNAPGTRALELVPFPPVPSNGTTSAAQQTAPTHSPTTNTTSHHTSRTVIAVAATLSAVLAIFILSTLYIKRRSGRRRLSNRDTDNGSEVTVTPFLPSIFMRTVVESSKRMPDGVPYLARGVENVSKANRLVPPSHGPTQAAALPPPPTQLAPIPTSGAVAIPAEAPALPAAEDATEEPIYRIHEDGGSVHEVSSTSPRQRQVIDLPPVYSSNFGRRLEPPEDSNAGAH